MIILDEYQNLLKDTLKYLKCFDKKFLESNTDFFKSDLINSTNKKKSNLDPILEKKKITAKQFLNIEKTIKKDQNIKKDQSIDKVQTKDCKHKKIEEKHIQNLETKELSKNETVENKKIIRDEKPKILEDNFIDIKKSIEKIFPNISILKKPIDDKLARQKSQKYKLKNISFPITILAYKEDEKLYRFLEKLSIAISIYFYPSKVVSAYLIEKENNWLDFLTKDILLIISCDYTIFELQHLRSFYKENPSTGEKHLKDIPLFLLPDIFLYLKEPTLKKSLFNTLKQKILHLKNDK